MNIKKIILSAIKRIGNSRLNKKRLRSKTKGIDKINVGCGDNFVENWLNIGLFSNMRILYGDIKQMNSSYVLHYDISNDFPVFEGSIKYIYASHFIEHLSFEDGMIFLKRCHNIMTNGSMIRLTFPNLEIWIKKYYENDIKFFENFYSISKSFPELRTKGEIFIGQIHGYRHKWYYDFESIKDILERAGFSNVTMKKAFDSSIPDILKLEPDTEKRLLETVYVEAEKV